MSFENRFYTTKEMYAEYVHKILCRRIYHMGIPLTVLAFLGCILSFRQRPSIAAVEAVCGIIILAVLLAAPPMMVRQLLETDRSLHQGERPECVITFDETSIHMTEGKQSLTLEYGQIKDVFHLKHSTALMFSRQNGILYSEEGFTVGNKETFDRFIRDKCPDARFH